MKVLLYGDYSRVHWTLAQGLRKLNVDVKVASGGDGWKNYPRDIDIKSNNKFDLMKLSLKHFYSSDFRNYDIVQLITYLPYYSDKWSKLSFFILKKLMQSLSQKNNKLFLSACSGSYYWVQACLDKILDYSFFSINYDDQNIMSINGMDKYLKSHKYNDYILNLSTKIIAGAYDYWLPYHKSKFSDKLEFIPFPINTDEIIYQPNVINNKIVFLIGIQKNRYFWKGLDWVCPVLDEFKKRYPNDIELCYVENIPYDDYVKIMNRANVVVDQVYSMGQGMNALTALAKGKIVMTGAEITHYSLIGESQNNPIINIRPDKEQIKNQLELILDSRNHFENWGFLCRKYIEDHHNYINIAKQYCKIWDSY